MTAGLAIRLAGVLLLAGCKVGPDYVRPLTAVPPAYKEAGWQVAQPSDTADPGAWWSIYKDPVLDGLERQIDISNQNLKAADAAFRQSEAIVAQARAGFFPTETITAAAQRSRGGGGGGSAAVAAAVGGGGGGGRISNFFSLNEAVSWVPDLWGKVWRTVEGDIATAQSSAADVASARLSAQGALASDYLQLRVADELKRLLDNAVTAYTESLRIVRNQYNAGIVAQSDVAQAETQLENARAQAIAVGITRAQFEHAIAVLTGHPPAEVTIAPVEQGILVPDAPAGLPAELLQRRPDIAAAERRMASANEQIGVAETAFFPNITLTGNSGVQSSMLSTLFTAPSRVWSFGGNLTQTIFDAGSRHAQVEQARAAYDAAVADYRQTVLTGFQQVEDELSALRILAQQAAAQEAAVRASREAAAIIFNQYKAGTVAYTNVVVAQTAALSNAETAVNIRQSRLVASAALVQALGGGWDAALLPSGERIEADVPLNFSPAPPPDANPRLQ
ncbi:MAG TPA: efflux transporter outer membrane subunit [Stellaceae bacterium]|jgi:NodT family efflux transporter outer membrane factor (OMF) lipoprotein|nr:efflux transporter outer membrane subunit [Stellaceae bacterium]